MYNRHNLHKACKARNDHQEYNGRKPVWCKHSLVECSHHKLPVPNVLQ
jgi:hypothetical protein